MEEARARTRCPDCERMRAECERLRVRVAEVEARLARAQKHSGNSSKPPSSDIVKPPPDGPGRKRKKRRRGGQPGHPRHERSLFPPEQVDRTYDHALDHCPDCGGELEEADAPPRISQQVEIVKKPFRTEEHRGRAYWCAKCRKVHYAPLPRAITKAGLVGPRLTALIAYLKGPCHASYSTIRRFLADVIGVTL